MSTSTTSLAMGSSMTRTSIASSREEKGCLGAALSIFSAMVVEVRRFSEPGIYHPVVQAARVFAAPPNPSLVGTGASTQRSTLGGALEGHPV